jgi:undecaprenyl-diphosphatase
VALRLTGPALSGILFAALTAGVTARNATLIATDEALSDAARSWSLHDPALHSAMAALSRTGSSAVLVTTGALAVAVLLVRRLWREAAFVVLAAVATTLARWLVRASVARPRPAGRLAPADGWAFPSGHTTSSTVAALIAVVLLIRLVSPGRWRSAAVVALSAWAVGVGLSRVFLAVHWPTDVVGGWLLATAAVPLCALAVLGPDRRAPGPHS